MSHKEVKNLPKGCTFYLKETLPFRLKIQLPDKENHHGIQWISYVDQKKNRK